MFLLRPDVGPRSSPKEIVPPIQRQGEQMRHLLAAVLCIAFQQKRKSEFAKMQNGADSDVDGWPAGPKTRKRWPKTPGTLSYRPQAHPPRYRPKTPRQDESLLTSAHPSGFLAGKWPEIVFGHLICCPGRIQKATLEGCSWRSRVSPQFPVRFPAPRASQPRGEAIPFCLS
jgi:hypothetical protein